MKRIMVILTVTLLFMMTGSQFIYAEYFGSGSMENAESVMDENLGAENASVQASNDSDIASMEESMDTGGQTSR